MTDYVHPLISGVIQSGVAFKLHNGEDTISYSGAWWATATETDVSNAGFVRYSPPPKEDWQAVLVAGFDATNLPIYALTPTFDDPADEATYVATWTAAQLKAQTPRSISSRQFYQALWEDGDRITYEQAADAINLGTLPAAIEAFVQMMEADPATEREGKRARLALTGAKTFERDHYFVMIFAAMFEMTEDEIDALWRLAATL